jgi:polyisoprenyl-phosphate glycosyltransferase
MAEISVVIPVFNEQENLVQLVLSLDQELKPLDSGYEIILVDDGSTDNSLWIIKKLTSENQHLKYISFSRNFGQQAALTAGIDFATGNAIITMDADLQDPPQLIPQMIEQWHNGCDIVFMRREHRSDGFFKRVTAGFYYYLLNKFSDYKFSGNVGDFRLIDKKVAEELRNLREKSRYMRGIIFWMGYPHIFLDYDRPNRTKGKSGFSLLKMARLGMNGILNFSLLPLRLGLVIGALIVFIGLIFLIYVSYDAFFNGVEYQLYKWLSITTFILTGFLFILIWIVGEYIGKIYNEVKNRPIYLIREKGNL